MAVVTPSTLLQQHLAALLEHLPRAFDGDVEGVHQARIATRRAREVVALVGGPHAASSLDALRAAGRRLGRVRDLDVMGEVLFDAEERMLPNVAILAAARMRLRQQQRVERRAMAKALEELDLQGLRDMWVPRSTRWRLPAVPFAPRPWVELFWNSLAARATALTEAASHAHGIYFPNRTHRVRIAAKKLRYLLEVGHATSLWPMDRMLKDLRRVQGSLGAIRDAQVAADALPGLVPDRNGAVDLGVVQENFHAEIARRYAEYVKQRDRVLVMAEVCARQARRSRRLSSSRPVVAASLLAVPFLMARGARATSSPDTADGTRDDERPRAEPRPARAG